MFGFLVANEEMLSEEKLKRYKSAYCGLCRTINSRHGPVSRTSLSYDLTFLVILLSSLYDNESRSGSSDCIVHPFSSRDWWENEFTAYAADINVALAYYKAVDNWRDDRSIISGSYSLLIKNAYESISAEYPKKFSAISGYMSALSKLEKEGTNDPDAASDCFGSIMAEILSVRDDRWKDTLRSAGFALGKFLYIMDACVDLDNDVLKGSYNPFRDRYGAEDNRDFFYDILKMFMGECLEYIDRLPLVEDIGIIRNILCCGAWAYFYKKYPLQDGAADVSGSV